MGDTKDDKTTSLPNGQGDRLVDDLYASIAPFNAEHSLSEDENEARKVPERPPGDGLIEGFYAGAAAFALVGLILLVMWLMDWPGAPKDAEGHEVTPTGLTARKSAL